MSDLKPIGGFFEFETPKNGIPYHDEALALTNGRACVSYIIQKIKPSKIYIPYFTCDALFEPMERLGVPFEFYPVDFDLDPKSIPVLAKNELLIYVNFYGIKNRKIRDLLKKYGNQILIDNTHNFFNKGYNGAMSFTSARKYFGVPDGAYLYSNFNDENEQIERFKKISISHSTKRLIGEYKEAYEDFLKYEASLNSEIKAISVLSEKILLGIDYNLVAEKRIENFLFIHQLLKPYNRLKFSLDELDVPFCYPFLPEQYLDKKLFHEEGLFIPVLWPEVLSRQNSNEFNLEKEITAKLLPLPIDQRYNESDMRRMGEFILQKLN